MFKVESFGKGNDDVVLERSFEELPHLIFKGVNTGLRHRISADYVATDARLQDTLAHLRQKPWMTDELFSELEGQIPWLQAQI